MGRHRKSRTVVRVLTAMTTGAGLVGLAVSVPLSAAGADPVVIAAAPQWVAQGSSPVLAVHLTTVLDDARSASVAAVERAEARSAAASRRATAAAAVQSERDSVGDAALRACTAQTGMTRAECIADAAAGNAS